MPATILELVRDALEDLSVIGPEDSISAADGQTALRKLNTLIDAWNAESLSTYVDVTLSLALVASQQIYTVGPGGDFAGTRPPEVIRAWVTVNQQDIPLDPLTEEQWDAIAEKNTTSSYPTWFWYQTDYPLGKVHFWPVPQQTYPVTLRYRGLLSTVNTLATQISFPPGYRLALQKALSVELASSYGQRAQARVAWLVNPANPTNAEATKRTLQNLAAARGISPLHTDFPSNPKGNGVDQPWNILTNTRNP